VRAFARAGCFCKRSVTAAAGVLCLLLLQLTRLQERQFYLEKLEAIERLCLLAGTSITLSWTAFVF
jgi:hypothetical protein